ncbi:hypothetical protein BRADI_1g68035v3 [Brachypodium distachyon]|uniref:Uncharacterized protein n=1 Tax=Brachypodium distachyon TaxID=15368 RepID=A0A2K2DTX1_BRADI|nr:hypothetical protein BRADI_1g68035v3 [Brachypodium distachyon]
MRKDKEERLLGRQGNSFCFAGGKNTKEINMVQKTLRRKTRFSMVGLADICCGIWTTRNKAVFEKSLSSFLLIWCSLSARFCSIGQICKRKETRRR